MYQPNYLNPPPPINNPLLSQQQRLLQLEQQQNMMNNNMMPPSYQQPQGIYLKGRAVTGIEEVRGTIIDQDGSLFIFPDIGHNKIYTKQINIDGTATINSFACYMSDAFLGDADSVPANKKVKEYFEHIVQH